MLRSNTHLLSGLRTASRPIRQRKQHFDAKPGHFSQALSARALQQPSDEPSGESETFHDTTRTNPVPPHQDDQVDDVQAADTRRLPTATTHLGASRARAHLHEEDATASTPSPAVSTSLRQVSVPVLPHPQLQNALPEPPHGVTISRHLKSLVGLSSRPPSPLPQWPSPRGPPPARSPNAALSSEPEDDSIHAPEDPASSLSQTSSQLPPTAQQPAPREDWRPYLLYLPDLDGEGMTGERALPGIAEVFDVFRLRINVQHEGRFSELADYVAVGV